MTRAPLAASGCPIAIAPPSTFVRSRGSPSSFSTARYCGANASFTSKRSKSESFASARSIALRNAATGPMPMMVGSTPTTDQLTRRARGLCPCFSAKPRVVSTIAQAPSLIPLAAPAWITPSFLKTFGSFFRLSSVVCGRACSSLANWTGPFLVATSIGAISSLNRPASAAAA